MSSIPQPTPLQLDPPGLYITPEVTGYAGPMFVEGRLPAQFCLFLADGTELRLPISLDTLRGLARHIRSFADQDT
jgi:hypothetical protein